MKQLYLSLLVLTVFLVKPFTSDAEFSTNLKVRYLGGEHIELTIKRFVGCSRALHCGHNPWTYGTITLSSSNADSLPFTRSFKKSKFYNGGNFHDCNPNLVSGGLCDLIEEFKDTIKIDTNVAFWDITVATKCHTYTLYNNYSPGGSFVDAVTSLRLFKAGYSSGSTPSMPLNSITTAHEVGERAYKSLHFEDTEADSVVVQFDNNQNVLYGNLPQYNYFDPGYSSQFPLDSMIYNGGNQRVSFVLDTLGWYYLPYKVYEYDRCSGALKSISTATQYIKGVTHTSTNNPTIQWQSARVTHGNGNIVGRDIYFHPLDTALTIEAFVVDIDTGSTIEVASSVSNLSKGSGLKVIPISDSLLKIEFTINRP